MATRLPHTESPWTVVVNGRGRVWIKAGQRNVARVCDLPERDRNAKVLAASPDMLDALNDVVRDLLGDVRSTVGLRALVKAQDAITKATA